MTAVDPDHELSDERADHSLGLADAFVDDDPLDSPDADETSPAIEALDNALQKRRILVLAGTFAISVSALIAVSAALLIHLLAAGGLLAALFFGNRLHPGDGNGGPGLSTGGDGFVIADDEGKGGKPTAKQLDNTPAAEALKAAAPAPAPAPAPLTDNTPPLPPQPTNTNPIPTAVAPTPDITPPVDPVGDIKVPAPTIPAQDTVRVAAAQLPQTPPTAIVPPPATPSPKNTVASATPKSVSGIGEKDAGEEIVNPGGTPDSSGDADDGIDIMGPGYKGLGSGSGSGSHRGAGLDRGPSGADNPDPQVLEQPAWELPASSMLHPPKQPTIFEVEILASGKVGKITLKQSSGNSDIDDSCRAVILGSAYRPAYKAGSPITKTMDQSFHFGPGTE